MDLHLRSEFYIDGSVQDCSISIANALEILQTYTNHPSILIFELDRRLEMNGYKESKVSIWYYEAVFC